MKLLINTMFLYESVSNSGSICIQMCLYLFLLSSYVHTYLKCLVSFSIVIFLILNLFILLVWSIPVFQCNLHSHSTLIKLSFHLLFFFCKIWIENWVLILTLSGNASLVVHLTNILFLVNIRLKCIFIFFFV
jgi:hypothetical protein